LIFDLKFLIHGYSSTEQLQAYSFSLSHNKNVHWVTAYLDLLRDYQWWHKFRASDQIRWV